MEPFSSYFLNYLPSSSFPPYFVFSFSFAPLTGSTVSRSFPEDSGSAELSPGGGGHGSSGHRHQRDQSRQHRL
jgi:hypothetical protein